MSKIKHAGEQAVYDLYKDGKNIIDIASELKCGIPFVIGALETYGVSIDISYDPLKMENKYIINDMKKVDELYDYINPSHYTSGAHECIDVMEAMFGTRSTAEFCKINAFKYRFRAGSKPGEDYQRDISKAEWYETKLMELNKKMSDCRDVIY